MLFANYGKPSIAIIVLSISVDNALSKIQTQPNVYYDNAIFSELNRLKRVYMLSDMCIYVSAPNVWRMFYYSRESVKSFVWCHLVINVELYFPIGVSSVGM